MTSETQSERPEAAPRTAPRLALATTMEGLALMERTPVGWTERGSVSMNEEDFRARMAVLRDDALALGAGKGVELWLPPEQVLTMRVAPELPGPDAFRRAMAKTTPHRLSELTWDLTPAEGGGFAVAATWKRTVREATAFAEEWRLPVLRVTTRAADEDFPNGPTFALAPTEAPAAPGRWLRGRRALAAAGAAALVATCVGLAVWLWPAQAPETPAPQAAFATPGAPAAPGGEAATGVNGTLGARPAASPDPAAPAGDRPAAAAAPDPAPPGLAGAPEAGPSVIAATALLSPAPVTGEAPAAPRRAGTPARAAPPAAAPGPEPQRAAPIPASATVPAPPPAPAGEVEPSSEDPPRAAPVGALPLRAATDAASGPAPLADAPPAALPRASTLTGAPERPADAPPPPEVAAVEFLPPAPAPDPEELADAAETKVAAEGEEVVVAEGGEEIIAEGGAEIPPEFEDFLAGPEDPRPRAKPGAEDAAEEVAAIMPMPRPGREEETPDAALEPEAEADGEEVAALVPAPRPGREEEAPGAALEPEAEANAEVEPEAEASGEETGIVTGDDAPSAHALKRAPRPPPRPLSAKDLAEAEDLTATKFAALEAPRPGTRPAGLRRRADALAKARAAAREEAAAEAAREARIPASASLAAAATVRDAVTLGDTLLIGVVGPTNSRRAILRLADGEILKVRRGESVGGWTVATIGQSSIRLTRGGRIQTLNVPGE